MNEITTCPCNSGLDYADCCAPYISGARKAPGPEALMRSRYTAYALQIMPYLAATLHPGQRHDYDEAGAARWARARRGPGAAGSAGSRKTWVR